MFLVIAQDQGRNYFAGHISLSRIAVIILLCLDKSE